MIWTIVPLIVLLGMWGGQRYKIVRRGGIPTVATLSALNQKKKWKALGLMLLWGILSMGYGENSWLMKVFKKDWIVRIVYGVVLSLPIYILSWKVGLIGTLALPTAWSLRLPSFKIYKEFDFLWEDAVRYTTLGVIITISIM